MAAGVITVGVIRAVLVLYLNRVRSREDDLGRGSYRIPVVATNASKVDKKGGGFLVGLGPTYDVDS